VGLALVVEGEVVIGIMGCPNWQEDLSEKSSAETEEGREALPGSGIVMIAHKGYGTWTKRLNSKPRSSGVWTRCFVDSFDMVHKARFCIPDSQTWESLPLSSTFNATSNANDVGSNEILILASCCGRYEIYYLYMLSNQNVSICTF
jgi:3'(2'), 5'-bisphosphate nucleotidase